MDCLLDHRMDSKPLCFLQSSNCWRYLWSRSVSSCICVSASEQMVSAETEMMKVVQMASFWCGSLGRLERSQSLQRQTAEKSRQPTFLLVLVVSSLQRSESMARVSLRWLRYRKGLFINIIMAACLPSGLLIRSLRNNKLFLLGNIYSWMIAQTRNLTPFQKIWNTGFNIRYTVIGLIEALDRGSLVRPGDCIYLLGRPVQITKENAQEQNALLFRLFSETPWLTYRSGFPQLYHDLRGTYVTDTGWGCMIRVGQMAFAEVLKEHGGVRSQQEMGAIIELFNDFDKTRPFSIQNISRLARKEYGILPGDWYNPSQIAHVLASLNQTHLEPNTHLSFLVFNSGNLFFDQITELMLAGREVVRCDCPAPLKQVVCEKCNEAVRSVGLVLLTRIGLQYPEEKYLRVLAEMMKVKFSKGVIGGRPGKALYFLGTYNGDSLVYLDPHYVQEAKVETASIQESYFCGSFRVCKMKAIDPSIGICYYLRGLPELNQFYREIERIKEAHEEFFLWASETTPSYLSKSLRITREIEIEEDHYQQL